MTERENIFFRILKRLGIITEFEVSKEDMCKQAQSICNHECEHCAWQTERSVLNEHIHQARRCHKCSY